MKYYIDDGYVPCLMEVQIRQDKTWSLDDSFPSPELDDCEQKWVDENIKHEYGFDIEQQDNNWVCRLYFDEETDAVAFKLKWI